MFARITIALLGLASLLQAQVVHKLNGPIAGSVSSFTWTQDGRYVLYGAGLNSPEIDVVTSVRVADGSEVVYDPYGSYFQFSAHVSGFVFLPDPGLAGVRFNTLDGISFPPVPGSPLHIIERSTAAP